MMSRLDLPGGFSWPWTTSGGGAVGLNRVTKLGFLVVLVSKLWVMGGESVNACVNSLIAIVWSVSPFAHEGLWPDYLFFPWASFCPILKFCGPKWGLHGDGVGLISIRH